jgi:hypothetical protein
MLQRSLLQIKGGGGYGSCDFGSCEKIFQFSHFIIVQVLNEIHFLVFCVCISFVCYMMAQVLDKMI